MKIVKHTYKHSKPYVKRKVTNKIIIHCEATPEGKEFSVETVDKWHKNRGFNCIGYHYCISLDGTIHEGRPEDVVGAHASEQNNCSIGISYVGGCTADGKHAKDTRTAQQHEALLELVHFLLGKYNLKIKDVYGHYQFVCKAPKEFASLSCQKCLNAFHKCRWASKACPSFRMSTYTDVAGNTIEGFREEYIRKYGEK